MLYYDQLIFSIIVPGHHAAPLVFQSGDGQSVHSAFLREDFRGWKIHQSSQVHRRVHRSMGDM
jgi:hypothetical protein